MSEQAYRPLLRLGFDIGSTTLKTAIVDEEGRLIHSSYERHQADIEGVLLSAVEGLNRDYGSDEFIVGITGSAGLGVGERCGLTFVQEVVASCEVVKQHYPGAASLVDIGGEDAKMIFFEAGRSPDIRMNGSCAGGTGAFIDQMAALLNVEVSELSAMASRATRVYPIASRCGVFSKTDIQNLLARNTCRDEIAASIFHAVSVQVLTTLSRGYTLRPQVVLCGGPFSFIPSLREAFCKAAGLREGDLLVPKEARVVPAWGAALRASGASMSLSSLFERVRARNFRVQSRRSALRPLFTNADEMAAWKASKARYQLPTVSLSEVRDRPLYIGIDSGSTTTKLVVAIADGRIVFRDYRPNHGSALDAVRSALGSFLDAARAAGFDPQIGASCVTGYGEDLVKRAFGLEYGMVETIAHYQAAAFFEPAVSFILDIGGQDMKAAFVEGGTISRLEINEACSSGCGSFIETFAKGLGYEVASFASLACESLEPCDLGTRCTVFMNSRVKQAQREGASVADISAGIGYSVVRNCLHKVLKLNDFHSLGNYVMVQGGTFRNPSVCRAFELETGKSVIITDSPELMGAFGAALYAVRQNRLQDGFARPLSAVLGVDSYSQRQTICHGCYNRCEVTVYSFTNGGRYYSGNKCERVFTNRGDQVKEGVNLSEWKYCQLRELGTKASAMSAGERPSVGLPMVLGLYEDLPFWYTFFDELGYRVVLSSESTIAQTERGAHTVMSDNICYPAKVVHGHILDLQARGVSRIFLPFVVYEGKGIVDSNNTYNCPVVSGYSEVIRSAMGGGLRVPVDSPTISFRDEDLLTAQCLSYVKTLPLRGARHGSRDVKKAVAAALTAQHDFNDMLKLKNLRVASESKRKERTLIVFVGRPYHADPLIQHRVSRIIAGFGVDVITEDVARGGSIGHTATRSVHQWAYTNRIVAAARWAAGAGTNVHYVQLTSFGCGPDSFLIDEVTAILKQAGKTATFLKVDDVSNVGSLRLRIRSLIESLKLRFGQLEREKDGVEIHSAVFREEDKLRTILMPWFADAYSPYLPTLFRLVGYKAENLPPTSVVSAEQGLISTNNEVCYPATLVVGDVMRAINSGKYKRDAVAVGITQTGGQCRATNYITLLKRALANAGYADIPLISVSTSAADLHEQPGFVLPLKKLFKPVLRALVYADILETMHLASKPRELNKGAADRLFKEFTEAGVSYLGEGKTDGMSGLLRQAARAFTQSVKNVDLPRVGIVGEIFVKYNRYANHGIVDWFADRGIEPVVPALSEFFFEVFASKRVRVESKVDKKDWYYHAIPMIERLLFSVIRRMEHGVKEFRWYRPIGRSMVESRLAGRILNLNAQFGEGWLIPGSFARFAEEGVHDIVCMQPFGCIANHIVAKGVEKRVKELYPSLSLLFLDLDSGVSEANFFNRLHFVQENAEVTFQQQRVVLHGRHVEE